MAPAELEDVLISCSNVLDAGVIGIPDEKFGEIPIAFVVPKNGEVSEHQIMDFTNSTYSQIISCQLSRRIFALN